LGVIEEHDSIEILKNQNIDDLELDETAYKSVVDFVWLNDELDDEAYAQLAPSSPEIYDDFPESLCMDKQIALARSGKITLTPSSFETAKDDDDLMAELILQNEAAFSSSIEEFPLSAGAISVLWSGSLNSRTREKIVGQMSAAEFSNRRELMARVGKFIVDSGLDVSQINTDLIRLCISFSKDIKTNIELILRVIATEKHDEIPELLKELDGSYADLGESGKRPMIPRDDIGLKLVRELERIGLVSRFTNEGRFIRVNNRRW